VEPLRIPSLGDVLEDIGVHDFDIMSRISSGPAKLYAQCHSEKGIFNSGTIMVNFESGTEHIIILSREWAGRTRTMDVSGTKGMLVLDLFGQIIKIQDRDQEPSAEDRTLSLPERGATIKVYGEPVRDVINDFLRCIETNSDPLVGVDDGVLTLKIVEAARKSANSGKVIDIKVESKRNQISSA
jgi:UDP-N-acetylglucosamine 3-dehydrogenase